MAFDGKLLSGVTVLIAVVEAETIARAAEALGLSPFGVSRALSRLKQRVGVRLLAQRRNSTGNQISTPERAFPSDCLLASQNFGQCSSAGQHRQQHQQAQDPASKVHWVCVHEAAIA
jgi:Bacterial regulatory helix-turn-helix protein, lysR family